MAPFDEEGNIGVANDHDHDNHYGQADVEMSDLCKENGDSVRRRAAIKSVLVSSTTKKTDIRDRAGDCIFLCLESPAQGQYAILMPCLRPRGARREVPTIWLDDTPKPKDWKPEYEEIMPWHKACESDADIYQRLLDTCYQHLGWWKRWLPYYGVTKVQEVNVWLSSFIILSMRDA